MKLSVLIPVYNEAQYLGRIVDLVIKQEIPGIHAKELVIVDDCSTDGTGNILKTLQQKYTQQIRSVFHPKNQGKGAAIRTAIEHMTRDVCIVQDADLEYSPSDYWQHCSLR